jgi:hypothetical protein
LALFGFEPPIGCQAVTVKHAQHGVGVANINHQQHSLPPGDDIAAHHFLRAAVSQFHFQIAQFAQARCLPLKFLSAAQINRDQLSKSKRGAIDPALQYRRAVASLQIIIEKFSSTEPYSTDTGVGLLPSIRNDVAPPSSSGIQND